jgi:formiminotetrahydrofolate cyclodeaminase
MPPLASLGVTQLLEALASDRPLPAGGSAAALAAAAGVSLLIKVATLPVRRSAPEAAAARAGAAAELTPVRDALIALIDRDAEAYARVLAAFRMPKETGEELAHRQEAITTAMRDATDAPLDTMRACREALRTAAAIAEYGPAAAAADVGVAVELLSASVRSAAAGIDSNLPALRDETTAESIRTARTTGSVPGWRSAGAHDDTGATPARSADGSRTAMGSGLAAALDARLQLHVDAADVVQQPAVHVVQELPGISGVESAAFEPAGEVVERLEELAVRIAVLLGHGAGIPIHALLFHAEVRTRVLRERFEHQAVHPLALSLLERVAVVLRHPEQHLVLPVEMWHAGGKPRRPFHNQLLQPQNTSRR